MSCRLRSALSTTSACAWKRTKFSLTNRLACRPTSGTAATRSRSRTASSVSAKRGCHVTYTPSSRPPSSRFTAGSAHSGRSQSTASGAVWLRSACSRSGKAACSFTAPYSTSATVGTSSARTADEPNARCSDGGVRDTSVVMVLMVRTRPPSTRWSNAKPCAVEPAAESTPVLAVP